MKTTITSVCVVALLTACETIPTEPITNDQAFFAAVPIAAQEQVLPVEIIEQVEVLPLPGQLKLLPASAVSEETETVSPQTAIEQGTLEARMEPTPDGYMNAVQVYPFTEGALYRLYCSPGQVSDISLQPGEELISVSAGDTVRWVVGDTTSGGRGGERAHVLVKPIAANLSTNLMIATDRRTYHLELESTASSYMAALSWRYPRDELEQLVARNDRVRAQTSGIIAPDLNLGDLNFEYRIEGDDPDWKPVRVFDDGQKVFIQMPDSLAQTDAPPLFILGRRGDAQLVNYRVTGKYYVVDRLFDRAELRLGERNQTTVRIIKGSARRVGLFGRRSQ